MKNIVIIGNGAAANSAAETIRKHDLEVPIVMVARENLPEYSACALPDCLSGWVDRSQLFIKQLTDYPQMGIQTRFGLEIKQIDTRERILISDQETIAYDQLILATGSRAIIPPVPGRDLLGNFVVKTVGDIDAILAYKARKVVVVGSGNIGIEVAEALQISGCQVTIVELMEAILPRIFDQEPAGRISRILSDRGIQVLTGERVLKISGDQRVETVTTDCRSIACDTVIWAAGVKQNVEVASAAGVKLGELGGIEVNSRMQTNIDGIYACGDCIESIDMLTGYPTLSLLWPNAKRQGQIAALNCLGQEMAYEGAVSLVAEDIYGITAVSMGLISRALAREEIRVLEGQDNELYWRVLVMDDRIIGMQTIGMSYGLGAVMALMKNRTPLSEFHRVAADPDLARRVAWYLPAQRFLQE
ncbi:MAG: FAD-dependent oxidoreductase [Syntrophomonas sp.]|nr:FAD-dependent oxidoreductase [Syntrophomonas sp.]